MNELEIAHHSEQVMQDYEDNQHLSDQYLVEKPFPQPPAEKVILQIKQWAATLKDIRTPLTEKVVFEFTPHTPRDKAYLMDRTQFSDGRYRVLLNPEWQPEIDAWLTENEYL